MKAWLKGGVIGIGIFIIGLIALFIDQNFFGGATTIFDHIYSSIFFLNYIFRSLSSSEGGTITADFLGLIISPIFYFLVFALIGFIIGKARENRK